jgi:hypothetical protein
MNDLSGIATWEDPATYDTAMSQTFPDMANPADWGPVEGMWTAGTVPLLHPMFKGGPYIGGLIAEGVYDLQIDRYIEELVRYTELGIKLLVGPYPEMNGTWVNYGGRPADAVEMFRDFVNKGRAAGLDETNTLWVWAPNNVGRYDIKQYFPGEGYVDIVGGSAYNWGGVHAGEPWLSVEYLFDGYVAEVREFTDKPIIITQTGSGQNDVRTPAWIEELVDYTLNAGKIEGYIWFDIGEFELGPLAKGTFKHLLQHQQNTFPDDWFVPCLDVDWDE